MYQRIILAYDGSSRNQKALLEMQDLAQWRTAQLTLIAIVPAIEVAPGAVELGYIDSISSSSMNDHVKEKLVDGVTKLRASGFNATGALLQGETIREITAYARQHEIDLIVVGHKHEKSLLRRWWTGSTAKSLVEESPCNVLIIVQR